MNPKTSRFGQVFGLLLIGMAAQGCPATQVKPDDHGTKVVKNPDNPQPDKTKPQVGQPTARAQRAFDDAVRSFNEQSAKGQPDYPDLERKFKQVIAMDDTFAEAYFNLGMAYERQGKWKDAIAAYEAAKAIAPQNYLNQPETVVAQVLTYVYQLRVARRAGGHAPPAPRLDLAGVEDPAPRRVEPGAPGRDGAPRDDGRRDEEERGERDGAPRHAAPRAREQLRAQQRVGGWRQRRRRAARGGGGVAHAGGHARGEVLDDAARRADHGADRGSDHGRCRGARLGAGGGAQYDGYRRADQYPDTGAQHRRGRRPDLGATGGFPDRQHRRADHRRCRRHLKAVAAQELAQEIGAAFGRRLQRPAVEVAQDIGGERFGARVAALAVLPRGARVLAPRFWGGVVSMPLLASLFSAMGIFGAYMIGVRLLGVVRGLPGGLLGRELGGGRVDHLLGDRGVAVGLGGEFGAGEALG